MYHNSSSSSMYLKGLKKSLSPIEARFAKIDTL